MPSNRTLIGYLTRESGKYEYTLEIPPFGSVTYTECFIDSTERPHILEQRTARESDVQMIASLPSVMLNAEGYPVAWDYDALYLRVQSLSQRIEELRQRLNA